MALLGWAWLCLVGLGCGWLQLPSRGLAWLRRRWGAWLNGNWLAVSLAVGIAWAERSTNASDGHTASLHSRQPSQVPAMRSAPLAPLPSLRLDFLGFAWFRFALIGWHVASCVRRPASWPPARRRGAEAATTEQGLGRRTGQPATRTGNQKGSAQGRAPCASAGAPNRVR